MNAILGDEWPVDACHTLRDATSRLSPDTGIIVCGVHFDQGAMFDLLRVVKADPATSSIPFLLIVRRNTSHSEAMIDGIRSAAKILGVSAFIDLSTYRTDLDDAGRAAALRDLARQALSGCA